MIGVGFSGNHGEMRMRERKAANWRQETPRHTSLFFIFGAKGGKFPQIKRTINDTPHLESSSLLLPRCRA